MGGRKSRGDIWSILRVGRLITVSSLPGAAQLEFVEFIGSIS